MTMPWLSQEEVDDLCEPLKQHAAQLRYIRRQGIAARTKPNGAPLVMRSHLEEVMSPAKKKQKPVKFEPNVEGLRLAFSSKKKKVAA